MIRKTLIFGCRTACRRRTAWIRRNLKTAPTSTVSSKNASKEKVEFSAVFDAEDEEAAVLPIESKSPVKGMFINRIDHGCLVFPEFTETDYVKELEMSSSRVENFYIQNVNSEEIDSECLIPEQVMDGLKRMQLFGALVPREYGGLGLCSKEYVRLCEELGRDWSVFVTMAVQDLVTYAINKYGTDQQKSNYLPKLASGEMLGAFCLSEETSGFDAAAIQTCARKHYGTGKIELIGRKSWVTNGKDADLLIVFAKSIEKESNEADVPLTTAYIVDRREVGDNITLLKRRNTIGLRGAEKQIAVHCNVVRRYDMTLSENPSIRRHVAEMSLMTFVLETMTYYLAGTIDENDPPKDIEMEGAIILRYAKRLLTSGLCHSIEIMGAGAHENSSQLSRLHRDAMTLSSFLSNNDVLGDQIALIALSTWAEEYGSDIEKIRNRLSHPWYNWKGSFARRAAFRNPKMTHFIQESVHPSLEPACRCLEESMARFEAVFTEIISDYGKDVQFECYILERLCEVASLLFSMVTLIARTSRSYSIGLRNADLELVWASAYCAQSHRRIMQDLEDLIGKNENRVEDRILDKVAEAVFQDKVYVYIWKVLLYDEEIMVNLKKGVLITCDPAMKQFLVYLDDSHALGSSFVLKDLDETHLLVEAEIVPVLQQKIDALMESLSPDLAEK